jgi:hypothetical protein
MVTVTVVKNLAEVLRMGCLHLVTVTIIKTL